MLAELRLHRFSLVALLLQAAFIAIFAVFADYAPDADARVWGGAAAGAAGKANSLDGVYPLFQDVHVMIFVGFGFLMTFLKWYGFSSVGYNMMIACLCIQWSLIVNGLFHLENGKFYIDIFSLLSADFACATVLITFGALLGRISPLQSLALVMIEIPIFVANEYVGLNKFLAVDLGGSMFVHVFGAYFGLAVSKNLARKCDIRNNHCESNYYNDLFAIIGTLFLWLYWPSFNSALATGDDRQRAVINTYLALASCAFVSFAASSLAGKGRFEMEHIQNATLAGGVAVGTVANFMIRPHGAVIVGSVAGLLSVIGYSVISPKLQQLHFLDTCGVNNLHGMPGLLAAVFGIIYSLLASFEDYGYSLYQVFPARAPAPTAASPNYTFTVRDATFTVSNGQGRSAALQALFQAAALSMTLLCAVIGGLFTGFLLKLQLLDRLKMEDFYIDSSGWHVPDNFPGKRHDEEPKLQMQLSTSANDDASAFHS